jgi:archaellum component FlaC
MPTDEDNNGRVTLGILGSKIDNMAAVIGEMSRKLDDVRSCVDRTSHIPAQVGRLQDDVETLQSEMSSAKTEIRLFGGVNGALAIIAGAIGSLFNPKM